jgi:hypothetical protein
MAAASKVAGALQGGLWRAVFQNEPTGRERGARGIHPRLRHGQRTLERPAPWPAATSYSGKHGRGARKPQFARELDGERAGGKRRLTTATKRGEEGSKWRNDARRR